MQIIAEMEALHEAKAGLMLVIGLSDEIGHSQDALQDSDPKLKSFLLGN